jgi:hypothetical protein
VIRVILIPVHLTLQTLSTKEKNKNMSRIQNINLFKPIATFADSDILSAQSISTKNLNELDSPIEINKASTSTKTLFEYFFDFWNTIDEFDRLKIELLLTIALLAVIIYFGVILFLQIQEKQARRYIVKFKFSNLEENRTNYGDQFTQLFAQIHTLAKGSVTTFEIHKQTDYVGFMISTTRKELAKRYLDFLFKYKGLIIEQATDLNTQYNNYSDPLTSIFQNKSKPYQQQLITSMEYGNLHKDEFETVFQITEIMKNLLDQDFASVILSFRPQHYKEKIKARISKLNYTSQKKSKKYGHDSSYSEEIRQLQIKNQTKIFATRITILATNEEIVDNLAVCFNNLESENYFRSMLSDFDQNQIRFIPSNNPIRYLFKKPFGSLLNCTELSSIAQICNFGNTEITKNSLDPKKNNVKTVDLYNPKNSSSIMQESPTLSVNVLLENNITETNHYSQGQDTF